MRRKLRNSLLFLLALVAVQQVCHRLGMDFAAQKAIIQQRDLDPAVFFYTESEQALNAEKVVRRKIIERSEP